MTRQHHSGPDLSCVERQAVAWAQKLASGEATPAEVEAAGRWRAQDPSHAAAFAAAERLWLDMGAARTVLDDSKGDYASRLDTLGRRRKALNRRMVLGGGLTAGAAVAALGVVRPPLDLWPSFSQLNADFRTGTGEQRKVSFAGTIAINLNTQTSLAIRPATAAEDRIELITGEASFEAPGRDARLLAVLAGNGRTITGAGRFEIRYATSAERSPVTVTCFDGRVRVEHEGEIAELGRGQRIRYNALGISSIAGVDPVVESEWQRGIVEFRNAPVGDVIEEINRYRPGRIILVGSALTQKKVNGRFRIGEMDEVLLQLQQAVDARIRRLPGGVVLLS